MNMIKKGSTAQQAETEVVSSSAAGDLTANPLKMTIPTGRIQEKVLLLLKQVGVNFATNARSYKPVCKEAGIEAKMLKGQNIPSLVALGRHDCGFCGYDWIVEQEADVVELVDLQFDPVRIIAAMPDDMAAQGKAVWSKRPLIIASEYRRLTTEYIKANNLDAVFLQTFGATEALPPEDADMIVDNTATGTTLVANRLTIIDELMRSTTRFVCNRQALEDPTKRRMLEELTMLIKSSLRARERVLLEMNVDTKDFERLVSNLPCMRSPTISELYGGQGYAIKIAVPSSTVKDLIPQLVSLGARDILEYKLEKIVT
jgi:ATP phosphoribosyltransferase